MTDPTAASTQLITVDELPESIREAVAEYGGRYGVDGLLDATTMAARTTTPSTRRRRFWRSPEPSSTYTLLSPHGLVVVVTEPEVAVTGWRLGGGEVRRVTESGDGGLHVTALRFGSAVRETTLVPLAADDEGAAFEAALVLAVSA